MICNIQRLYWTILISFCVLWSIFVWQKNREYEIAINDLSEAQSQSSWVVSFLPHKTKLGAFPPQTEGIQKEVRDYIIQIAQRYNLGQKFVDVAKCESDFIPQQSKIWHNGRRENSWGVWQINLDWHPEITQDQAMNVIWSTNWAKDRWLEGKTHLWACYKNYENYSFRNPPN